MNALKKVKLGTRLIGGSALIAAVAAAVGSLGVVNVGAASHGSERLLLVFLASGALAGGLTAVVVRNLTRQLREITERARRMGEVDLPRLAQVLEAAAEGDLREEVSCCPASLAIHPADDIGGMASAVNGLDESLQRVGRGLSGLAGRRAEELHALEAIAGGNLAVALQAASDNDRLGRAILAVREKIAALAADTTLLTTGAREGRLATRADATRHQGAFRGIVEGFNATLDAVIGPLNVAAEYVDRIGKGEIPPKITEAYNGDFNEIKNNLNSCIDGLGGLVEANAVLQRMAVNDHTVEVEGAYSGVFAEVARAVNEVRSRLLHVESTLERIGHGDLSELPQYRAIGDGSGRRSATDRLVPSVIQMMEAVTRLVEDAGTLSSAAVEGRLAVRADASRHEGDFRAVIEGVNATLDAVIGPLNVAAEYVDRISKGDMPPAITDAYRGDFNEIKNNLNTCIEAVRTLVDDANALTGAAVEGRLATRADATRHRGEFRRVVEGVNATLDAVIGPLNMAAGCVDRIAKGDLPPRITDRYDGDFEQIKNNLNACIEALTSLVSEMNHVSQQHDLGATDATIDAAQFKGAYRAMAEGINTMLAGHIAGNGKAMACVAEFGKGNFDAPLERFPGKKASINETIEQVRSNLKSLIRDTALLTEAALAGRLRTRADAARHPGDFGKIIEGINRTLDLLTEPIVQVTRSAQALGASSEQLNGISQHLSADADQTAAQTGVVSAAAEQVSKNLGVVATGAEQMVSSIREIAKSATDAAKLAKNAVGVADATNATVQKLGDSSVEIGNVIKVITSIAEQTNLLALNATIEAARAGDAGKGFAVVANEVKELAKETARATEEISHKIEAIQHETHGAVEAIAEVSGLINQIDGVSNTIASAVEEQTVTTNDIGRNIAEAAGGANEITRHVTSVAEAARSTAQGATDTQKAAGALTDMAGQLRTLVGRFTV